MSLLFAAQQVIKALYDYTAPSEPNIYLSFSAGDFLHVISRENDADWYEACNPLKNERGLVPVKYFDEVGKTVRDSGDSTASGVPTHDSGYAEARTGSMRSNGRTSGAVNGGHDVGAPMPAQMPGHRASKSVGRSMGGVYGIVSYDFQAERPDELDAKEGEPIIVIAQSNPEWFVAKPITRLGGPGLIPVSFIEIRDMSTGKAVDDTTAAIAAAGIPKVEEWKKMAAEYKNTSIPLGTVSAGSMQEAQQGMERMSLSGGQQQSGGYGHSRQPSNSYNYQQQQQQNLFAPVRASVPRYIFADEKFHFVVECKLSNGSHWDLSRIYEDFYELQINLINAFPEEAGQVPGKQRILPYMPGPVKFVTDNISEGRRANLDEYLRDLLRLRPEITSSSLVRNFFAPRHGDYEVDLNEIDLEEHARTQQNPQQQQRYSNASQQSHNAQQNGYTGQQQRQPGPQHNYNQSQTSNGGYGHQRQQQSYSSQQAYSSQQQPPQQGHYRSPSSYSQHPNQQQYNGPPHLQAQTTNASSTSIPSAHSNSTAPVKVKAWFDRDTCVVLRMPPRGQFSFSQLYQKIVERRKLEFTGQDGGGPGGGDEELDIEYRDEKDGEYYRLEGDDDLDIAVERNEKLTLAVRATGS